MTAETKSEIVQPAGQVDLGKYAAGAGLVGIVGVGGLAVYAIASGSQSVLGSYLFGLIFWTAISLAMYGLTVLNHTVRSTWTLSVLRMLEAGGGWITLSLFGIAFLAVVTKLSSLYQWADPSAVANSPELQHKAPFLNTSFWTIRLIIYFLIWIGSSYFFRKSVLKQEATKDFNLETRRMSFAAPSLLLFFVTGTFAFIDWTMSLEPKWYSTMYPLWFTIGSSLGAYALCVVLFNLNGEKTPFKDLVTYAVRKDQSNMLFVHTMLWGYTSISQYLIIWNGNLPETTAYYVRRSSLGWNALGMATIFGQFFIPFFSLLSPRIRQNAKNLRSIAGWMFAVHVIDFTLIVAPALPGRAAGVTGLSIIDAVSWLAFGALFMFGFSLMWKKAPSFPTYDTRLQEAKANAH